MLKVYSDLLYPLQYYLYFREMKLDTNEILRSGQKITRSEYTAAETAGYNIYKIRRHNYANERKAMSVKSFMLYYG